MKNPNSLQRLYGRQLHASVSGQRIRPIAASRALAILRVNAARFRRPAMYRSQGRASRPGCNARQRGSRRGRMARNRSPSGDDPGGESEPLVGGGQQGAGQERSG
jgi:hypothetical protein